MYGTYGAYYNSEYRLSTRLGVGYRLKYGGIDIGAVTGYSMGNIVPSIVPYFSLPITKQLAVQLAIPFTPGTAQVMALQIKYKVK